MKQRPVTLTIELMTSIPLASLRKVKRIDFADNDHPFERLCEGARVNVIRPAATKARKAGRGRK